MRLKIVSDGTPLGTRVEDAETGEKIEFVRDIQWGLRYNDLAVATITIIQPEIEAEVDGEIVDKTVRAPDKTMREGDTGPFCEKCGSSFAIIPLPGGSGRVRATGCIHQSCPNFHTSSKAKGKKG